MAHNTGEALEKIGRAEPLADMLEIRLDVMKSFSTKEIVQAVSKPIIVTYRSQEEGGKGSEEYEVRAAHLLEAVEVGADFVDVEYSLPMELREELFRRRQNSGLIISSHLLKGTPPVQDLEIMMKKLVATGADIVKIVTRAETAEDNLRVLNLIPLARGLGVKSIAFCLGPLGRISRIASLLVGGFLTFASMEKGEESAEGQIPVREMKQIIDFLRA